MISSIGVMIVIINTVAMVYGNETKIINTDISNSIIFGGIILTYTQIAQLVFSSLIFILFFIFLKYSQFGIKTRAMRDDDILFTVFGQNLPQMRTLLFILSGMLVSIGSIMVAYDVGFDPYVGMPMLLNAIVALIIGGIGRFEAPIMGGFILGILQALSVYTFSARWQDAVTFILLIAFLLFRPQGILGEKHRAV
jgi:branched-chain amino acid transport system permease protein